MPNRTTITEVREDLGSDIVNEYLEVFGYATVEDVDPDNIYEAFMGSWESGKDFIEEWTIDIYGEPPEPWKFHIDFESMWHDADCSGDVYFNRDTRHVWNMNV